MTLEDVEFLSALCLISHSWSDDPDQFQGQSTLYHKSQGCRFQNKLSEFINNHYCTKVCGALHLSELVEIPWMHPKKNTSVSPIQSVNPSTSKAIMTSVSSSQPENNSSFKATGTLEHIDLEFLSVVFQGQNALAAHNTPL
ncbi:hypothetical protein VP01_6395g1 [Puccinia sorghi]|uniref:Alpha-type protein kinase domain-containing protein n=1 Tax=Puccinia sorghi TaxID=27349 RepID=A0A0L6UGR9_9BASI|nr:hypothetical protein VP01_6395g1 [Puccinia sorghi]